MKVIALFGGGKDSTYAIYKARKNGLKVKYLLVMFPKNRHSWMFHPVNPEVAQYQAKAIGIRHLLQHTSGKKDEEINDLREAINTLKDGVDCVISGAMASNYQKSRIEQVCNELDLTSLTPLWGQDPLELLWEMIDVDFEVIITSVSARGLDESWLGRKIDKDCIEDLEKLQKKFGINPAGEGGEYETLVLDAPFFKKRISPIKVNKVWERDRGHLIIERAEMFEKL